MTALPPRIARTLALLPALAWALALIFAAWVTAQLFWRFAAPDSLAVSPRHETDPRAAARSIAATLGSLATGSPAAAAPSAMRYRAEGLATGFDGLPGFVLLRSADGRLFTLAPGETLPDGLRLEHIDAEGAYLSDDSGLRRLHVAAPHAAGNDPATPD